MAPEIVRKLGYSFGADVWACGVLLYKLVAGVFPFRASNEKDLFIKITKGKFDFPTFLSLQVKNLISSMLKTEIYSRLSMEEVLHHPWLE
jgi:MAP/microtubule affinity-regulating kinase